MVHPDFRGLKLARRLYDARKQLGPRKEPDAHRRRRPHSRLRRPCRQDDGPRIHRKGHRQDAVRSGADDAGCQRLRPQTAHPRLPGRRRRIAGLRRVSGMGQPRLSCPTPGSASCRSPRCASASSSTRCGSWPAFEAFAEQCEYFLDVASEYKCDFIVFPEIFTTQLLSLVKADNPAAAMRKLSEFTPQLSGAVHPAGGQVQRQRHRRLAFHASRKTISSTSPTCSAATARWASNTSCTSRRAERTLVGRQGRQSRRGVRHRQAARSPSRSATTSSFPR